jgi:hypothetical protein
MSSIYFITSKPTLPQLFFTSTTSHARLPTDTFPGNAKVCSFAFDPEILSSIPGGGEATLSAHF